MLPIWSCFPDYSAFGHVFPFSSFALVFFAWPCFPIFPLLALFSHFSLLGLVFLFFLYWPCPPIFHLLALFSHFSYFACFPYFSLFRCAMLHRVVCRHFLSVNGPRNRLLLHYKHHTASFLLYQKMGGIGD